MQRKTAVFGVATLLACVGAPHARAADQALIDAAKREGGVTWYTTQLVDLLARPVAEAFQKRYGIKVDYVRAESPTIVLRVVEENRAGKNQSDVVDGLSTLAPLKKEGLVLKWRAPSAAHLPKDYLDKEGYWAATNLLILTPGFNTQLVPKGTEPRTWDDFLDPKWSGKMLWGYTPNVSSAPGVIGLILTKYGEQRGMDYLKRLAQQKVQTINFSARQVYDQVVAGEYPIGLEIFNHHAVIGAAKGAPIAWIPVDPGLMLMSVVAVNKNAPHPQAGKLLVDFLISDEGQKIFVDGNYVPVTTTLPLKHPELRPDGKNFRAIAMTPEEVDTSLPKWIRIYNDLFR
jgi:ABC-type Fe3+ transport system substrate-binding protein